MMALMNACLIEIMVSSLIQPATSSFINAVTGKWVRKAGIGQEGGFVPLLALELMMKVLGRGVRGTGRRYNNMDHMDKSF